MLVCCTLIIVSALYDEAGFFLVLCVILGSVTEQEEVTEVEWLSKGKVTEN